MASTRTEVIVAGLLVGLGMAAGGSLGGHEFYRSRALNRTASVKGLAEREVRADVAVWPMQITVAGNDLTQIRAELDQDVAQVLAFLERHGLSRQDVVIERLAVTDTQAQAYGGQVTPRNRYIVQQTATVRTGNVDAFVRATGSSTELLEAGVVLSDQMGPSYLFTRLNDIKPEMIAEATRNARAAAMQFAEDAGSRVGSIVRAQQGQFLILPRDSSEPYRERESIDKIVRVVSTIEYQLVD
jgi:hypothetical protein